MVERQSVEKELERFHNACAPFGYMLISRKES